MINYIWGETMKRNLNIFVLLLSVAIVSCGKENNVSSQQESISKDTSTTISESEITTSESNVDTSQYAWYFKENKAYKGVHNFSIDSKLEDRDLKLLIDNQEINPLPGFLKPAKEIFLIL